MDAAFDAMVFAGGGSRCLWQAGFHSVVGPELNLRPKRIAAVSAGAAMACMLYADASEHGLRHFLARTELNARNVDFFQLFRGRRPFPHEDIYRGTILRSLDDEGMQRLLEGPDILVVVTRPPPWLGPRTSVLAGALAWYAERRIGDSVHSVAGRRVGFRAECVSIRTCQTPDDVADLILHSSCTPPLLPYYKRGAGLVLDGGLVTNTPVEFVEDARRTLVLLAKTYQTLPVEPGRVYVQPSQPPPVQMWDYTSPDLVQRTFDLGRRDGDAFLERGATQL